MIVVADASPLTALLHLNHLAILIDLYKKIIIPASVANELQSLEAFGYDISFLKMADVFPVITSTDIAFQQKLMEHLDAGESEAIALAKELDADWLLIDEKLGKRIAAAESIPCKGVVGVLLEAKAMGLIPAVKPLLNTLLVDLEFRLADNIIKLALQKAGEWNETK
jgi:uncharacterized protein